MQVDDQILKQCKQIYKQILGSKQIIKHLKVSKDLNQQQQQKFSNKLLPQREALLKQIKQQASSDNQTPQQLIQNFIDLNPNIKQVEYQITEIISLNHAVNEKQTIMKQKQSEYKELMRKHYKFVKPSKVEEAFNKYIKEKLIKNLKNFEHEMQEVYETGSRSSISSSSGGIHGFQNWVYRQKQEKLIKQHENLLEEIRILQKQLAELCYQPAYHQIQ